MDNPPEAHGCSSGRDARARRDAQSRVSLEGVVKRGRPRAQGRPKEAFGTSVAKMAFEGIPRRHMHVIP